MPSPRILVTGAAGLLGGHLCRLLGPGAVGLDRPKLDITCRDAVLAAVQACRPDTVINAAAFTRVDRAESEPQLCRAVNLRGVENLLAACRHCGVSLVQVSTDYVFDGRSTVPYSETDAPRPLNVYGQTKWEAEQIVAQLPRHLVVRTAALFGLGPSRQSASFVDTMLRLAAAGQHLRVVNDQISSFTFAADLALAIQSLLVADATGLFHVVNAGHAAWYQFALEIFRIARLKPNLQPVPRAQYPAEAKRPPFSALSTAKYDALPDHYPMPCWQQALAAYLALRQGVSDCEESI
ncbi:MAG: dTDP-4-dehydrorhamnose reductase [Thermoguttaceae bacterium]